MRNDGGGTTQEYNGSAWFTGGSPSSARSGFAGAAGSAAAGIIFAGITTVSVNATEEYSGGGAATNRTITST